MQVSEPIISIQSNGKWRVRCRVWEGKTARWKSKTLKKATEAQRKDFEDKKEIPNAIRKSASEWMDQLKSEEAQREREAAAVAAVPGRSITVPQYVTDYIEGKRASEKATLRTTTDYYSILNSKICPDLENVMLADLTPEMLQQWVNKMLRTLSDNTVHKSFVFLKAALDRAVADSTIPTNPARSDLLEVPSQKKPDPNPLTEESNRAVQSYLDNDPGDRFSMTVRIALYTGMRRGEICGLRWGDIDFKNRTMRVCREVANSNKTELKKEAARVAKGNKARIEPIPGCKSIYIKLPKSDAGKRTVHFPESMVRPLQLRKAQMAKEAAEGGWKLTDESYVTGDGDGRPYNPSQVTRRWIRLASLMNLMGTESRTPCFHDLRHTYATTAIAAGVDVKTLQNQLGHASASMTLDIYAGFDKRAALAATDTIDKSMASIKRSADIYQFPGTGTEG